MTLPATIRAVAQKMRLSSAETAWILKVAPQKSAADYRRALRVYETILRSYQ